METPDRADDAFVRLIDVTRNFGVTRAVRGVTMDLAIRGKVHALVGENGAGKSTCLGIAAGRIPPTSGAVRIGGEVLSSGSPRSAKRLGVQAIYQELTILPALTPEANVFLGRDLARFGWLRDRAMRQAYERLCDKYGFAAAPRQSCHSLSVAEQQTIEILRALASEAQCILFDEPTASLAEAERDALFRTMTELKAEGLALTIVGHNLDEMKEQADIVTVFRDGSIVETRPAADWTKKEMVSAMLGKVSEGAQIASGEHHRIGVVDRSAAPALAVHGLSSPGILHDVSFDVRPGEVLGIAGLVGAGRTSILRALAGLDAQATGEVRTAVTPETRVPRNAHDARRRGISLQPEDRKGQGLFLALPGTDNVVVGEWHGIAKGGFLAEGGIRKAAERASVAVGFNASRLGEPARNLSGGNQQKLMIARWIHTDYPVLLADEPTRGVDVGAKAEILIALEQIVAQGRSMIVVSSELEEVIGMSDRILVIHEGRALALLDAAEEQITPDRVLRIIFDETEANSGLGTESTEVLQ